MGHRALTMLAGISLILLVTAAVFWSRSYRNNWRGETATLTVGQTKYELRSQGGGVRLYEIDRNPWFFSGVATGGKVVPRYNASEIAGVPYALAIALAAVLPMIWLIARLRRSPLPPGHCPICGYDLRATPGRCPECGTATSGKTKSATIVASMKPLLLMTVLAVVGCDERNVSHADQVVRIANDARVLQQALATYAKANGGQYPKDLGSLITSSGAEVQTAEVRRVLDRHPDIAYSTRRITTSTTESASTVYTLRLPTGVPGNDWVHVSPDGEIVASASIDSLEQ